MVLMCRHGFGEFALQMRVKEIIFVEYLNKKRIGLRQGKEYKDVKKYCP